LKMARIHAPEAEPAANRYTSHRVLNGRFTGARPTATGSTRVIAFAHQGLFAQSAIIVSTHADVCALVLASADVMRQSFLDHCSICAAHV